MINILNASYQAKSQIHSIPAMFLAFLILGGLLGLELVWPLLYWTKQCEPPTPHPALGGLQGGALLLR